MLISAHSAYICNLVKGALSKCVVATFTFYICVFYKYVNRKLISNTSGIPPLADPTGNLLISDYTINLTYSTPTSNPFSPLIMKSYQTFQKENNLINCFRAFNSQSNETSAESKLFNRETTLHSYQLLLSPFSKLPSLFTFSSISHFGIECQRPPKSISTPVGSRQCPNFSLIFLTSKYMMHFLQFILICFIYYIISFISIIFFIFLCCICFRRIQ